MDLKLTLRRILFTAVVISPACYSGEVEVVKVKADCQANTCRFDVTLRHQDEGWDHYANRWRVLSEEGKELGIRTLHHPHVNEQPFTRGLGGVDVPVGIKTVHIVARDSVHGESEPYVVKLKR